MVILVDVPMCVLLVFDGQVIQGMVFVKSMVFNAIDNFVRVHMIIFLNNLNYFLLNY